MTDKSDNEQKRIELLKLLKAKQFAIKDSAIDNVDLSLIQKAYACSPAKIRILCGANRSGKSFIGAVDTLMRSIGMIPKCLKGVFNKALIRFGEYWITSLDFPSSREITQRKILDLCPKRMQVKFNKEFRYLQTVTGSVLGFKSADSGRDKFQGTSKVGIWNDEEGPEDVWDEEYMRTTDCAGWLSLTFTPLKGLSWAYKGLYLKASKYVSTKNIHGIEEGLGIVHTVEEIDKLKERRLVVLPNTSEEADTDIEVFNMSIYDNKILPSSEIQKAERKYKNDPLQYHARILGQFTKLSGRSAFNIEVLLKRQAKIPSVFKRGEIENGMFRECANGRLTMYIDKKSIGSGVYVLGGDVAEGIETGDYSCVQVMDRRTCEQVAVWHGKISPEKFAVVLYNIGKFFNNAFIGVERQAHGHGVLSRLRDMKYLRIYHDYSSADKVLKQDVGGEKRYGWDTNRKTKPIMIADLAAYINDGHVRVNDFNTIEELLTYVYLNDGQTGAMGGCHDDRVMALAIALQMVRNTPVVTFKEKERIITDPNNITGY